MAPVFAPPRKTPPRSPRGFTSTLRSSQASNPVIQSAVKDLPSQHSEAGLVAAAGFRWNQDPSLRSGFQRSGFRQHFRQAPVAPQLDGSISFHGSLDNFLNRDKSSAWAFHILSPTTYSGDDTMPLNNWLSVLRNKFSAPPPDCVDAV